MKIAALAAVLALASPLAAFAQAPAHTVVTHEVTRSGPIVTKTTVTRTATHRVPVRHYFHHRLRHPIVRKEISFRHGPNGARTVTTTTVTRR